MAVFQAGMQTPAVQQSASAAADLSRHRAFSLAVIDAMACWLYVLVQHFHHCGIKTEEIAIEIPTGSRLVMVAVIAKQEGVSSTQFDLAMGREE